MKDLLPEDVTTATLPETTMAYLQALADAGFLGEIDRSMAMRTALATDNSIYQVLPEAVVFPRNEADLVLLARLLHEARFRELRLRPRGGGTGTNGQSLGQGVIVDCSRHMTAIGAVNLAEGWVEVEPGVIKDKLNEVLRPLGLFFAPELSTSNRATIGGMISTDACGQGSCVYGKTSDHVLGLRLVLAGGEVLSAGAVSDAAEPGPAGRHALEVLAGIARDEGALIAARFPKLNRALTGYNLAALRGAGSEDARAVVCGGEGTLGLIARARLNVLPIPAASALITIAYDDFAAALDDAPALAALGVTSVETMDSKVFDLARADVDWLGVAAGFPEDPEARGVNIMELTAAGPEALSAALAAAQAGLAPGAPGRRGHREVRDPKLIKAVWNMRKKAVGLLGGAEGARRPLPFVEDCAVPPEELAAFIKGFRAILDAKSLQYGMFGHVDAGVLHVRPALDLSDPAQVPLIREITEAVEALARRHGGLLWGEHGKGVRSEFVPGVFGPLYPALRRVKGAFDPYGQMNPGKIAMPEGMDGALLRIDEVPMRGAADASLPRALRDGWAGAFGCNGNGACHNRESFSVMCPSYKATGDRRHAPKGRAMLIREWLRQGGAEGRADPGFEAEVKAALDGCLSCAGCATQCPVRVDIPEMRARFLDAWHRRHPRPLRDRLMARLEGLLPLMARAPGLFNAGLSLGRAPLQALGLTALPKMDPAATPARFAAAVRAAGGKMMGADGLPGEGTVILPDAFTRHFDPRPIFDLVRILVHLGEPVWVAPYRPSGKARHVLGRLEGAKAEVARLREMLAPVVARGLPVVGIEPAVVLELRKRGLDVALPQERLAALTAGRATPAATVSLRLIPHCTERALAAGAVALWPAVMARFGIATEMPATGCCGMAGTWGHETANARTSARIFDQSWRAALAAGPASATGYSCRCQTTRQGMARPEHPLSTLAMHLATPQDLTEAGPSGTAE